MIKWEQIVFLGNPEFGCELQPDRLRAVARACGGDGFTVDDPAECGDILDEAFANAGPGGGRGGRRSERAADAAEGDVEQAKHLAESLVRGEPNREKIVATILADKVRELV